MKYTYRTKGTCSQLITFDMENGKISNIEFLGGCNGNLQGIAKLADGKDAKELIHTLEGIKCGFKPTSCPDQLAKAIKEAIGQ